MAQSQLVSAPQDGVAWWPEVFVVLLLPIMTFGFSWWSIGSLVVHPPPTDTVPLIYLTPSPTLSSSTAAVVGIVGFVGFVGLLGLYTERCRRHRHLNGWWPAMSAAVFAGALSAWSVRGVPATAAADTSDLIRLLAAAPVVIGLVAWAVSNRGHTRRWQRYFKPRWAR